jgi:predicted transcriptional regulator
MGVFRKKSVKKERKDVQVYRFIKGLIYYGIIDREYDRAPNDRRKHEYEVP